VLLETAGQPVEENFLVPGSASRITATVQHILLKMDEWQREAGVKYISLYHNRPSSRTSYQPMEMKLLPIDLQHFQSAQAKKWPSRSLPTFTMEREQLLSELLQQYFFVSIFRACAESLAAEHASRLNAMQRAEKNLEERNEELTNRYRRERQVAITGELLDVISGFEALTGEEEKEQE
jgi:F-type H+-transporting ATPase subunit gamma